MNKRTTFLMGVAGLVLAVSGNGALAATECNGVITGTVVGGVVVNAGDFCLLGGPFRGPYAGAQISGGVQVNTGGILIVCASTINDGLVANGAANLLIGPEEIGCPGNIIKGGVRISNTGPGVLTGPPSIGLERNAIHGAVRLTGNQGRIVVSDNLIAGSLFCANNASNLEDEGRPNVVTGATRCEFE